MHRRAAAIVLTFLALASGPVSAQPGEPQVGTDQILADEKRHAVIRDALAAAPAPDFLTGNSHFLITFDTRAKGVSIDEKLRAGFPRSMTIILQHDFLILWAGGDSFTVVLRFDGVEKALTIPYAAVTEFRDPGMGLHLVWPGGSDATDLRRAPAIPSSPRRSIR